MPLQATSGAASYDAFGGGVAAVPNYIEEVFSTWLYTGNNNGSTGDQSIVNGIDLSGKGGLVWIKNRNDVQWNTLQDTARGRAYALYSNSTSGQTGPDAANEGITSFNSNGFSLGKNNNGGGNTLGNTYASWTFREQPKFFDVVTFSTTTGSSVPITVNHNLGSVPGCIIVKQTNGAADWFVYHRSLGSSQYLALNSTDQSQTGGTSKWYSTPTSTSFTLGGDFVQNATYVAYVFAHNAGGFGLTGTDNVISCGSYTGNGSTTGPTVNLGYEPQWILLKNATTGTTEWVLLDNMRGMAVTGNSRYLRPNSSGAESGFENFLAPTATGFQVNSNDSWINSSGNTYIYIAIRRGPMKVPTTGTSVFDPEVSSGATGTVVTTGFPVDLQLYRATGVLDNTYTIDRLRGVNTTAVNTATPRLFTSTTGAETTDAVSRAWDNTGFQTGLANGGINSIYWNFRRAPGFFDEVCYTGTGSARTVAHNLTVVPELMIVKSRSSGSLDWLAYNATSGNTKALLLNTNDADFTSSAWNNTTPTSSVFSTGATSGVNNSGQTFVAYLFASCPGVSKVFNFTGNGSSQTINCGFTGGARFVMIKRTDSTGDWYVWDTARGIVANNDPHLSLNTTAAEVTSNDTIDTDSTGFVVNQVSATNVNVNGASYIGLAIA